MPMSLIRNLEVLMLLPHNISVKYKSDVTMFIRVACQTLNCKDKVGSRNSVFIKWYKQSSNRLLGKKLFIIQE